MIALHSAAYLDGYRIELVFNTGEKAIVDLGETLRRYPQATCLLEEVKFRTFYLDEWPTLVWPCGFDLSAEYLYELATGRPPLWAGATVAAAS